MKGDGRGSRLTNLGTRSTSENQTEREQRTVFNFLGDTEIGNFDSALVVDEDVSAFDVTMNDVFLVQVCQALQNLSNKVLDEGFLKGAIIPQQGGDGTARHIFQKNVQMFLIDARGYDKRFPSDKGVKTSCGKIPAP